MRSPSNREMMSPSPWLLASDFFLGLREQETTNATEAPPKSASWLKWQPRAWLTALALRPCCQ